MSNIIYSDKMYNEAQKQEYLDEFKPGTKKILERIFKISYDMESELKKDLCVFSREELRRLFYLFLPTSPNASKGNVLYVQAYIDWALENDYGKGLNPLDTTDTKWKEQFVVRQNDKRFWTNTEIDKMLDPNKIVNAQDRVIVSLLFEGIKGQENAEIVNLKRRDVDNETGELYLTDDDGSTRTVKVSDKCLMIIQKAIQEDDYIKKNGNSSGDVKAERADLINNHYVVRSSHTRTINVDAADSHIVYRRLKTISEALGEPNLNPSSVYYSGMLYFAKTLLDESGKLESEEYEKIAKHFHVSSAVVQRLKGDFLNEVGISDVYGSKS